MQNEINLLKTDKKVREKKSSFFKLCLSILTVVVLFTAAELVYTVYLKNNLSRIVTAQSAALNQIVSVDGTRVKFQTLKERLQTIGKILPQREIFKRRLEIVTGNIPSGVAVNSFDIDKNTYEVRVNSSNLSDINSFLEKGLTTIAEQKIEPVAKITVGSVGVSKSPDGYATSASITF